MQHKKLKAFTLVELIVVITVLAILGTIAFISLQGYSKDARNSVRLSDLQNIETGLELYKIKAGTVPIPDNYIEIYSSGTLISYQGYTGDRMLELIGIYNGGNDPLDEENYTYMTDFTRKNYQVMGFLESDGISLNNINNTFAAENRTPYVKGDDLGIIVDLNNDPVQKIITSSIDISNTNDIYKAFLNNNDILSGTGIILKKSSPTYSCNRILSLKGLKSRNYNIDNHYTIGSSKISVYCDEDLNGLTPITKSGGGEGGELIISNKTFSNGDIIVGGMFGSSTPTIFGETLTNNGTSTYDYFLAKLDSDLNTIWIKSGGGSERDNISTIDIDSNGNIIIGGTFKSATANIFGETVTNNGGTKYDYFLAKLDSDGNTIWVKNGGGTEIDTIGTIEVNSNGDIFVGGLFRSSTATIFGETLTNTGTGTYDYFLAKLDSNGNTIWVKNGGSTDYDYIRNITIDSYGDIFVGGYFKSSTITVFGETLTNTGSSTSDYFLAKLNSDGNTIWVKNGGGTDDEYIISLNTNTNGDIIIGGYYNSTTATIFGENISNNGTSTYDYFLAKLNSDGNTIWVKNGGGTGNDIINSTKIDSDGNIYIGGYYSPLNANIFGKELESLSTSTYDYYLTKLDSNGNTIWIKNGGGILNDTIRSIDVDSNGNILIGGGTVSTNINFLGEIFNNNSSPAENYFLIKLFK